MLNAKEIRTRIKSIQDTRKITNAMYMIASSKMRKAKAELDKTRPYFNALNNEIGQILQAVEGVDSPYFTSKATSDTRDETYGLLVITADKGLAGSYNKNVIRQAQRLLSNHPNSRLFVVGEYGRRFFTSQGIPIVKSFLYTAQNPTMDRAREISSILLDLFEKKEIDKIYLIYSELKNSLVTDVVTSCLLPFEHSQLLSSDGKENKADLATAFEFYPSIDAILDNVVESWISGFIYSALVDSFSSEQSARMTAMNAANRNAEKILADLTLQYNWVRQATITQEITEITAGARAQKMKRQKEGQRS